MVILSLLAYGCYKESLKVGKNRNKPDANSDGSPLPCFTDSEGQNGGKLGTTAGTKRSWQHAEDADAPSGSKRRCQKMMDAGIVEKTEDNQLNKVATNSKLEQKEVKTLMDVDKFPENNQSCREEVSDNNRFSKLVSFSKTGEVLTKIPQLCLSSKVENVSDMIQKVDTPAINADKSQKNNKGDSDTTDDQAETVSGGGKIDLEVPSDVKNDLEVPSRVKCSQPKIKTSPTPDSRRNKGASGCSQNADSVFEDLLPNRKSLGVRNRSKKRLQLQAAIQSCLALRNQTPAENLLTAESAGSWKFDSGKDNNSPKTGPIPGQSTQPGHKTDPTISQNANTCLETYPIPSQSTETVLQTDSIPSQATKTCPEAGPSPSQVTKTSTDTDHSPSQSLHNSLDTASVPKLNTSLDKDVESSRDSEKNPGAIETPRVLDNEECSLDGIPLPNLPTTDKVSRSETPNKIIEIDTIDGAASGNNSCENNSNDACENKSDFDSPSIEIPTVIDTKSPVIVYPSQFNRDYTTNDSCITPAERDSANRDQTIKTKNKILTKNDIPETEICRNSSLQDSKSTCDHEKSVTPSANLEDCGLIQMISSSPTLHPNHRTSNNLDYIALPQENPSALAANNRMEEDVEMISLPPGQYQENTTGNVSMGGEDVDSGSGVAVSTGGKDVGRGSGVAVSTGGKDVGGSSHVELICLPPEQSHGVDTITNSSTEIKLSNTNTSMEDIIANKKENLGCNDYGIQHMPWNSNIDSSQANVTEKRSSLGKEELGKQYQSLENSTNNQETYIQRQVDYYAHQQSLLNSGQGTHRQHHPQSCDEQGGGPLSRHSQRQALHQQTLLHSQFHVESYPHYLTHQQVHVEELRDLHPLQREGYRGACENPKEQYANNNNSHDNNCNSFSTGSNSRRQLGGSDSPADEYQLPPNVGDHQVYGGGDGEVGQSSMMLSGGGEFSHQPSAMMTNRCFNVNTNGSMSQGFFPGFDARFGELQHMFQQQQQHQQQHMYNCHLGPDKAGYYDECSTGLMRDGDQGGMMGFFMQENMQTMDQQQFPVFMNLPSGFQVVNNRNGPYMGWPGPTNPSMRGRGRAKPEGRGRGRGKGRGRGGGKHVAG